MTAILNGVDSVNLFERGVTFGITLPHFGPDPTVDVAEGAKLAESLGFDAIWLRDHLALRAGQRGEFFLDALTTAAVCGTVTDRISIGFATLTPHRHPLLTAGMLSSIEHVAGPRRLVVGLGIGSNPKEFEAVGMAEWDRRTVVREYVDVMRSVWKGVSSYTGEYYHYDELVSGSLPVDGNIWVSYCGTSKAAFQRALDYADSWGPVKLPTQVFATYVRTMTERAGAMGMPRLPVASSALIAMGDSAEQMKSQLNIEYRLRVANEKFPRPPSGAYRSVEDLRGLAIYGTPADVAEVVAEYFVAGTTHFVFDFRDQFSTWGERAREVVDEVIPLVRQLLASADREGVLG